MKRVLALVTLNVSLLGSLAGCAAPGAGAAESGGPTFIQMPVNDQALVGATPQLLSSEFGQPALLRVDGTAQVWLYHAGGCGMNLILYPDNAGTPRVTLAAATNDGPDLAACSAALQRAHADSGASQSAVVLPAAAITAPAAPAPAVITPVAAPPAPPPAITPGDGLERDSAS